jgi:putative tricarboxylic transport membrane protein
MKEQSPNWDSFTGLFSIAFGVIYGIATWNMPRAAFGNAMDPLYFPLGVAGVAVFIGLIMLVKSNFAASLQAMKNLLAEDNIKKKDRRRVLYTCLVGVGYALIFERLGYIISTFLFIFAMQTITSGWQRWLRSLIVAILFSGTIFFIFSTLLSVSLPPLPFGE